jgi:hypothetical protein
MQNADFAGRVAVVTGAYYSILPILIGDGIRFFEKLHTDIALHLVEVKAYKSGTVELHYEVRGHRGEPEAAPPNNSLQPTPASG